MNNTPSKKLYLPPDVAQKLVHDMRTATQVSKGQELKVVYNTLTALPEEPITYFQIMFLTRLFEIVEGKKYDTYDYDTFVSPRDHITLGKKEKRAKEIPAEFTKAVWYFIKEEPVTIVNNDVEYRVAHETSTHMVMEPLSTKGRDSANTGDIQLHITKCLNKIEKMLPIHPHLLKKFSITLDENQRINIKNCTIEEYDIICGSLKHLKKNSLMGIDDAAISHIVKWHLAEKEPDLKSITKAFQLVSKFLSLEHYTLNDYLFVHAVLPHLQVKQSLLPTTQTGMTPQSISDSVQKITKNVVAGFKKIFFKDTEIEKQPEIQNTQDHLLLRAVVADTLQEFQENSPKQREEIVDTLISRYLEQMEGEDEGSEDTYPRRQEPDPSISKPESFVSIEEIMIANKAEGSYGRIAICHDRRLVHEA